MHETTTHKPEKATMLCMGEARLPMAPMTVSRQALAPHAPALEASRLCSVRTDSRGTYSSEESHA